MPGQLYHYTYAHKLASINQEAALVPTGVSIPPHEAKSLWFSFNDHFEPTALKPVLFQGRPQRVPLDVLERLVGGVYRFCISLEAARHYSLTRWPDARRAIGIRTADAARMERVGRQLGAVPSDWFATLAPIRLDHLALQKRVARGHWEPIVITDALSSACAAVSVTGPKW